MTVNPAMTRGEHVEAISDAARVAPMIVWLLVQVFALLLAAARVPIWARFDAPIESWALCWMLAIQLAASALLFPWLMPDLRAGVCVALISLPFLLLAGLLARNPFTITLRACGVIQLWLAALTAWRIVLTSRTAQLLAAAIVSITTIGAAGVVYLAIEFNDAKLSAENLTNWAWIALIADFFVAMIAVIMRPRLRAKLSTV